MMIENGWVGKEKKATGRIRGCVCFVFVCAGKGCGRKRLGTKNYPFWGERKREPCESDNSLVSEANANAHPDASPAVAQTDMDVLQVSDILHHCGSLKRNSQHPRSFWSLLISLSFIHHTLQALPLTSLAASLNLSCTSFLYKTCFKTAEAREKQRSSKCKQGQRCNGTETFK